MRKYFILTGKLLKSGLGDMAASGNKKKKNRMVSQGLIWVLLLICLIPMFFMLYKMGVGAYDLLAPIGQEGIVLDMAFMAASIMSFFLGFPMILSVFYMTGDVEKLLYLPLHSWQIVGAKFSVSLIYTYLASFYFLCPLLAGYGIASGVGALYWIFVVIAVLVVPIMPLVYSAIISMVLMRVFKGVKNKDFLSVIGVVIAMVFAFGISSVTSGMGTMSPEALISMLVEGRNSLIGIMNGIFPTLRFVSRGVAEENVLQMLLFLAITAAAVAIFLLIAEKLYFAGAMGMRETTAKRKRISAEESKKMSRRKSARKAYLQKELRLLFRTPIYFMNCVMLVFLWPLLIVIPVAIQMGRNGVKIGELFGLIDLSGDGAVFMVLFVMLCVAMGASGIFNYVAGTAISREGKNFTFMKVIPVPYKTQLLAKLLSGVYIGVAGTLSYSLIFLAVMIVGFGLPAWTILPVTAANILANLIQCLIQLFIDLFHPKLSWESEQQAVKQNLNVIIAMLVNLAAAFGLGTLVYRANGWLDLSPAILFALVCGVLFILTAILYTVVMRYGVKKIESLE